MYPLKKQQSGFTLIELVMVIVILGILAATALPKFVNLSGNAEAAALSGVQGALNSANAVNIAARSVNVANGAPIANCQDGANLLVGGLPSGYSIASLAIAAGADGACTLTQTSTSNTAAFTLTGIL